MKVVVNSNEEIVSRGKLATSSSATIPEREGILTAQRTIGLGDALFAISACEFWAALRGRDVLFRIGNIYDSVLKHLKLIPVLELLHLLGRLLQLSQQVHHLIEVQSSFYPSLRISAVRMFSTKRDTLRFFLSASLRNCSTRLARKVTQILFRFSIFPSLIFYPPAYSMLLYNF